MELFSCPECGYENQKGSRACERCLLVFEKYERKKTQSEGIQVRSSQKLEAQWQAILTDYENYALHEKFVSDAASEKSLPYASKQYKNMLDINAADEMAKKMIDKIIQVATVTYVPPFRKPPPKSSRAITFVILFIILVAVVVLLVQAFMNKGPQVPIN